MAHLLPVRRPTIIQTKNIDFHILSDPLPETSVELPLLPGSLSLSKVAELQANSDGKLKERQGPKESVAASYGSITVVRTRHTKLHRQKGCNR